MQRLGPGAGALAASRLRPTTKTAARLWCVGDHWRACVIPAALRTVPQFTCVMPPLAFVAHMRHPVTRRHGRWSGVCDALQLQRCIVFCVLDNSGVILVGPALLHLAGQHCLQ